MLPGIIAKENPKEAGKGIWGMYVAALRESVSLAKQWNQKESRNSHNKVANSNYKINLWNYIVLLYKYPINFQLKFWQQKYNK